MSITVTVNGQGGPTIAVKSGDQVGVSVGNSSSSYTVGVSPTGTPGGQGPTGPAGPPYTVVDVGSTTTLAAGANATVTATSANNGANLTLAFGIPAGASGAAGANGVTPSLSIGNVSTLASGSNATVTATASNGGANVVLSFGIPTGPAGANAVNGVTGVNNLTGNLTLAAGGNVTITPSGSTLTIAATGGGVGPNDAIDGGTYTGTIVGPTITITKQPQNSTATLSLTLGNLSVGAANVNVGGPCVFAGGNFLATTGTTGGSNLTLCQSSNGTSWLTLATLPAASGRLPKDIVAGAGNVLLLATHTPANYTLSWVNGTQTTVNYQQLEVFRSSDGGATFSNTPVVGSPANQSLLQGADQYGTATTSLYGGSKYLVMTGGVASGYQTIYTSSDSSTWTARSILQRNNVPYTSAAYGNSKYVLVANGAVATSTDAIAWTTSNTTQPLYAVAYGGGRFVATRNYQGAVSGVSVSTDGTNWSNVTLPAGVTYSGGISYAGGLFAVFGQGVDAAVSQDGENWSYVEMPGAANQGWGSLAHGNNIALALQQTPSGFTGYHTGNVITGAITQANTATAAFAVSATITSGVLGYQWQRSTDSGGNWTSVSNATSSTLTLSGLNVANDNGSLYRVSLSATGATTVISNSALLTVQ